MKKGLKIWLWIALALSLCTTVMNACYGRWVSVVIAVGALAGLCVMLFLRKGWGFTLMCGCYVLAFAEGVWQAVSGQSGLLVGIGASFIGSALIPCVTYLFLRKNKDAFTA